MYGEMQGTFVPPDISFGIHSSVHACREQESVYKDHKEHCLNNAIGPALNIDQS